MQNSCIRTDADTCDTRYLTNRFATVSLSAARRLTEIDGIPFERVQQTSNVKLLHVHHSEIWAWWSDGRLSTGLGLDPLSSPNLLSADAVKLIHKVCLSVCSQPACGWGRLAEIQSVRQCQQLAVGPIKGNYKPERLMRLEVEKVSGERVYLYTFFSVEGLGEYFSYEVSTSLPVARLKSSTINQFIAPIEKIQLDEGCNYLQLESVA